MGLILDNPPLIPNTETDSWQPLVERDAAGAVTLNNIRLTNWPTGSAQPLIAAGSTIDITGSIAVFPSNEAIGGSPPDGTVYVRFNVSAPSVTPEWTNIAPSYDVAKGQWSDGTNVYSGHFCTKTGSSYTNKRRLIVDDYYNLPGRLYVDGLVDVTGNVTANGNVQASGNVNSDSELTGDTIYCNNAPVTLSHFFPQNSGYVLPKGIHYLSGQYSSEKGFPISVVLYVEVFSEGSWTEVSRMDDSSYRDFLYTVISDGINFRIFKPGTGSETFHWAFTG